MTALLATPFGQTTATTAPLPLVLEPPRHVPLAPCLLTPGQVRIGAGEGNQIRLGLDGIAPEHAVILVGSHRVVIRAWDPRTWLNDGPVREAPLRPGDRLSLGPISFRVRRATPDELLDGWPAAAASASSQSAVTVESRAADVAPPPALAEEPSPVLPAVGEAMSPIETLSAMAEVIGPFEPAESVAVTPPVAVEVSVAAPTDWAGDDQDSIATLNTAEMTVETYSAAPAPPAHVAAIRQVAEPIAEMLRQHAELSRIRQELDAARLAWQAESSAREQSLASDSVRLSRQVEELHQSRASLERRENQLSDRQLMLDRREEQIRVTESALRQVERELADERSRIESLASDTRRHLEAETARQAGDWEAWERQQQGLLADLAAQSAELQLQRQALAAEEARLQGAELAVFEARRDIEQLRQDLEAERDRLSADRQTFQAEREAWQAQQQVREQQFQIREREADDWAEQLRRQQEQLSYEVRQRAKAQADLQAAQQQLQQERRLFADLQSSWQQERDAAWQEIAERRRRLDAEVDRLPILSHHVPMAATHAAAPEPPAAAWSISDEQPLLVVDAPEPVAVEPIESVAASLPVIDAVAPEVDEDTADVADVSSADETSLDAEEESFADSGEETLDGDVDDEEMNIDEERADIQAALDALAQRFEEFSELEQRLTQKHDELREQQQDLAVREAAWYAEREAIGLERATWEAERLEWEQEQEAWFEAQDARRQAWEIARQAEAVVLLAERRRWAAQAAELMSQTTSAIQATAATSSLAASPSTAVPVAEAAPVIDPAVMESIIAETTVAEASETDFTEQVEATSPWPAEAFAKPMEESTASPMQGADAPLDSLANQTEPQPLWSEPLAVGEADNPPTGPDSLWALREAAERTETDADEPTPAVRSELARMFDLPADFAEHSHAAPPVAAEPAEAAVEAEPDWRSQALSALGNAEPEAEPEEPVEEDSIASYMERLLDRTRKSAPPAPARPASALPARRKSDSPSSTDATAREAVANEEASEYREPLKPRAQVDHEATRAALQSFREVANLSARQALAAHSRKSTQTDLAIQVTLGLCSTAGAAALLTAPLRGGAILWGPALGCALAAGWMGYRLLRTCRQLIEQELILDETDANLDEVQVDSDGKIASPAPVAPPAAAAAQEQADAGAAAQDGSVWATAWSAPAPSEHPTDAGEPASR
jgi:hypothetical protein